MLLVDRQVVGLERTVREDEARHRLAREVDEPVHAPRDRGLQHVERAQQVVAEDDVRRVVDRLRDRGGVDDDVATPDERVGGSRVGEVGLPVVRRLAGVGAIPVRPGQIAARTSWPGRLKRRNERASDLAVRAGDENSHAPNLLSCVFESEGEVDVLGERSLVEGSA